MELRRDEQAPFFLFFSCSFVLVRNSTRDLKLLLIPVEPPRIKASIFCPGVVVPGWETGTKASSQPGLHAVSVVVLS